MSNIEIHIPELAALAAAIEQFRAAAAPLAAELRKHTELLTNLCRHQDDEVQRQEMCGAALPGSMRTAEPMPDVTNVVRASFDPASGCAVPSMSEESLKAEFSESGPAATDDTLALLLAEVRSLRADFAKSSSARPMRALSSIAERTSEVGQRAMSPIDFKVFTYVTKAVGVRPATSFSVVRLLDSQPAPGLPALTVSLEAELTPSEQRVLADLLLSVVRRTQPDSDRPAS
ncbi:hypothetical protein [Massilia sp. CCM 8734]|uniref:hypothetical protein n=1 Tax=Massilia sp. CCM 8734 TaxID=2609283 RepID=UPI00141F4459|nr:hypothetical protein [Massilia sp. CCM 8734]NHZ94605.1 hypothetical protein [Massilia sp. CCM 8734]